MVEILNFQQEESLADRAQQPGLHLIGDLYDCCNVADAYMFDAQVLGDHCQTLVEQAGLTVVGKLFHAFENSGGVTGMVVLAESHLSIHTWPEHNYVTIDVYVCNYSTNNRIKAQTLFDAVIATFNPQSPVLHHIDRA